MPLAPEASANKLAGRRTLSGHEQSTVLDSETNIHPEIDQVCNRLDHNHSPVMDSNIVSMTLEMASAINGVFIHPSNSSYDKLPKVLRKTNESTNRYPW